MDDRELFRFLYIPRGGWRGPSGWQLPVRNRKFFGPGVWGRLSRFSSSLSLYNNCIIFNFTILDINTWIFGFNIPGSSDAHFGFTQFGIIGNPNVFSMRSRI